MDHESVLFDDHRPICHKLIKRVKRTNTLASFEHMLPFWWSGDRCGYILSLVILNELL